MDEYLFALGLFPGINFEFWQKTTAYLGDFYKIWNATPKELKGAGINDERIKKFCIYREKSKPKEIYKKYQNHNIKAITIKDGNYPPKLKEIYNPPFVIYYLGEIPKEGVAIAVVGARKCTDYGRRATADITSELARAGITIVSGLALGLDAEAHKATLKEKGVTIAVLANGLDAIYPSTNTALAKEILKRGAIISEQPIGMPALKQNFPARNRIISGISDGVLITEASTHSGTLHTANFALEQNRNVYAVPGPIYNETAQGPNLLIKMGAKPVSSAQDILEDFGINETVSEIVPENEDEETIFEILKSEPKHIDLISSELNKTSAETSQILTMMEIKGKIRHLGGMVYSIKK